MLEAEGIDLLKRMLDYDPAKRISVGVLTPVECCAW
jgi:hypothetical protein